MSENNFQNQIDNDQDFNQLLFNNNIHPVFNNENNQINNRNNIYGQRYINNSNNHRYIVQNQNNNNINQNRIDIQNINNNEVYYNSLRNYQHEVGYQYNPANPVPRQENSFRRRFGPFCYCIIILLITGSCIVYFFIALSQWNS